MKTVRTLFLAVVSLGLIGPSALEAQASGRVFNPEINPMNSALVSFERQEGDRRELYFRNTTTGRTNPLRVEEEGGALTFDLPGADDLSAFSGDLDWSPRGGGAGYPFAFVEATRGGLGLFLASADQSGEVAGAPVQVAFDGNVRTPRWSPNGNHIAFSSDGRIFVLVNARGAMGGSAPVINEVAGSSGATLFPAWSPDGQYLAYQVQSGSDWNIEIAAINNGRAGERVNLTASDRTGDAYRPSWSMDGRYVAYYSGRSGGGMSALDIGVVQPQMNPQTNAVFRGEVLTGRARRIAQSVLPNDVRGPTWTWVEDAARGQRLGIVYVEADNTRDNPISVASLDRWLSRDADWTLELSERAAWGTQNNRYVTQAAMRGQIMYAFAAQEGNAENLEIRTVAAPWLTQVQTVAAGGSVGFIPAALFPGTGQLMTGQTVKGAAFLGAGIGGLAGAAFFGTKSINKFFGTSKVPSRAACESRNDGSTWNDNRGRCKKPSNKIDNLKSSKATGLYASLGIFAAAWAISTIDALGGGGGSSMMIQDTPVRVAPVLEPRFDGLNPSVGFQFSLPIGGR